jgi:hypothetical protein
MRTTLTLEPDVVDLIEQARHKRRGTFKQIVNDALREGLRHQNQPPPARKFETQSVSVGKLLIEHFESIGNVLDEIEGPYWK